MSRGTTPLRTLDLRDALEALTRIEGAHIGFAATSGECRAPELTTDDDRVRLGSVVTVRLSRDEEEIYTLVTPVEAAPRRGRLSIESPIGRAPDGARLGGRSRGRNTGWARVPQGETPELMESYVRDLAVLTEK